MRRELWTFFFYRSMDSRILYGIPCRYAFPFLRRVSRGGKVVPLPNWEVRIRYWNARGKRWSFQPRDGVPHGKFQILPFRAAIHHHQATIFHGARAISRLFPQREGKVTCDYTRARQHVCKPWAKGLRVDGAFVLGVDVILR